MLLLSIASTSVLICFLYAVYLAYCEPEEFLKTLSRHDKKDFTIKKKIFMSLIVIGSISFVYGGFYFLLFWIPESTGSIDEYGDFTPFREYISCALGIILGLCVIPGLEKYSKLKLYKERCDIEIGELKKLWDGTFPELSDYLTEYKEKAKSPSLEGHIQGVYSDLADLTEHKISRLKRIERDSTLKKTCSRVKLIKNITAVQDSSNSQKPSCNSKTLLIVFGRI